MGTLSKVKSYVQQALFASDTNAKLDAIARAIQELADLVDDIETKVDRLK